MAVKTSEWPKSRRVWQWAKSCAAMVPQRGSSSFVRADFPHAACAVTLVGRLVDRSEIFELEGDSYRLKETKERAAQRTASRREKKSAA